MKPSNNKVVWWVLCACLALWGCQSHPVTPLASCPQGGTQSQSGTAGVYCVWEQGITETGFRCPDHLPHGHLQDDRVVCTDDPAMTPQEVTDLIEETLPSPNGPSQFAPNKVDILWVVDNSGSMCEERANLKENFDRFIQELSGIGTDFRLAVITTDMSNPQESGRFQNTPSDESSSSCNQAIDISQCPDDGLPLVIDSTDEAYRAGGALDLEKVKLDFGCIASVANQGNGFEAGLEAALTALSPALLSGHNQNFLREDADLAIVFLSDENDCSDRGVVDKTNGNICEWEEDKLVPVEEYIEAFTALKGSRERVIMAGIIAPDTGVRYVEGMEVQPSCFSDFGGEAYAGYRYEAVIRAFPNNAVANVCNPPFDDTLSAFGRLHREAITNVCLRTKPAVCQSDADCGGDLCMTRNNGIDTFCASLRIQTEITRRQPINGRECTTLLDGERHRCRLIEGPDYGIDYNDTNCESGLSVDVRFILQEEDQVALRFPTRL